MKVLYLLADNYGNYKHCKELGEILPLTTNYTKNSPTNLTKITLENGLILIYYSSKIIPFKAIFATMEGKLKYSWALGFPILPLKFLFPAEITVSPSPGTPKCVLTKGLQPNRRKITPTCMRIWAVPSFMASINTCLDAGAIKSLTPVAIFLFFRISATSCKSFKRPLLHIPTKMY